MDIKSKVNKNEIRRVLQLSGMVKIDEVIDNLYENYYDMEKDNHNVNQSGLEGPFIMENTRVVLFNEKTRKFIDARSKEVLSESEVHDLYDDTKYEHEYILHAKKGDETINLRLESMMAMMPVTSTLRDNGYDDFSVTDKEGETSPLDFDKGDNHPDGDMATSQLSTMKANIDRLVDMGIDDADFPAWVSSKITKASDYLDMVSDYLAAKDDDLNDKPEQSDMSDGMPMEDGESDDGHDASSIISVLKYYGDDITPEQSDDIQRYIDRLNPVEQSKVYDYMKGGDGSIDPRKAAELGESKDDQKKIFDTDGKFSKGDKVKCDGKEMVVVVPDAKANMIGISDKVDGKVDMVKASSVSKITESTIEEGNIQTYAGWKAALKKKFGGQGKISIEGDKDIAQAWLVNDEGKKAGIGEWDGASGEVESSAGSHWKTDESIKEEIKALTKKKVMTGSTEKRRDIQEQIDKLEGQLVEEGNDYSKKTDDELKYIQKDASEAAKAMKGMDDKAEAKYLDQVNDASTELHKRSQKKKTEEVDVDEAAKGRSIDTKITPSLSQAENNKNKKAMNSKERQQGKKEALDESDKIEGPDEDGIYSKMIEPEKNSRLKQKLKAYSHDKKVWDTSRAAQVAIKKALDDKKSLGEAKADDATVFTADMPFDAIDDKAQSDERTGKDIRNDTKVKTPSDVMSAIDKRIKELNSAIDRYDNKGYDDKSIKGNVVDALEQIKTNLKRGDMEGFVEAQMFFNTLMSPMWDMIPAQVVKYLYKGSE